MQEESTVFDNIATALEGQTVIPQPRVSRETIVDVLKQQNDLLRHMQATILGIQDDIATVKEEQVSASKQMKELEQQSERHREIILKFGERVQLMETDMSDVKTKLLEVNVLNAKVEEQHNQLEFMDKTFKEQRQLTNDFISRATIQLENHAEKIDVSEKKLHDLSKYVTHFADNLILSSSSVMVEVDEEGSIDPNETSTSGHEAKRTEEEGGEGQEEGQEEESTKKRIPLTIVLGQLKARADVAFEKSHQSEETLLVHSQELEGKATKAVEGQTVKLREEMDSMQDYIENIQKRDTREMKRKQGLLEDQLRAHTEELELKIDEEGVDEMIHKKYEDIIDYLQSALKASEEDEATFQQSIGDIKGILATLQTNKADKLELSELREAVVEAEAKMLKMNRSLKSHASGFAQEEEGGGGGGSPFNGANEGYDSPQDLEARLAKKLDKSEFEYHLNILLQAIQHPKKSTSFLPQLATSKEKKRAKTAGRSRRTKPEPSEMLASSSASSLSLDPFITISNPSPHSLSPVRQVVPKWRKEEEDHRTIINEDRDNMLPPHLGGGFSLQESSYEEGALRGLTEELTMASSSDRNMIMGTDGRYYFSNEQPTA